VDRICHLGRSNIVNATDISSRRRRRTAALALALSAGALLLAATRAHAAEVVPPGTQVLAVATLDQTIGNIRNWIVGIAASVATVYLTWGGLRYMMAGGEPGEVEKAKVAIRSSAVGYGIAILAPVLVTILKGLVGAGS